MHRSRRPFHLGPLAFAWMPKENADGCDNVDRPWGVVDGDGNLDGCFADEAEATARADELNAADADDNAAAEVPFRAVIAIEGFETGDGRVLEVGGWNEDSPRMLPLPMWVQTDQPEWGGHAGAFIGGRMTSLERMADGRRIYAEGFMSTADERGAWAEDQIRSQNLRFVSIDVGEADVEYEVREIEEDGWPTDVLARFTKYEIMGATVVAAPAIAWAVIWLDGMDEPAEFTAALPSEPERVTTPDVVPSDSPIVIMASGRDEAGHPPAEWFEDPELDELTHLTVTEEGRVFGHLAPWGECHIGRAGCITAPHSDTDYAHFRTGETLANCDCDEADANHLISVPTGVLTLGTNHAGAGITAQEAAWHYDNTGAAVCDVAMGEDEWGVWFSGAVRQGITEAQIRELRAADISGDWRRIGGNLELVAALAVNVPGFPIPRRPQAHLVASASDGSAVQTSLISPVGTMVRSRGEDPRLTALNDRVRSLEAQVKRHESVVAPLAPMAAERLVASIHERE